MPIIFTLGELVYRRLLNAFFRADEVLTILRMLAGQVTWPIVTVNAVSVLMIAVLVVKVIVIVAKIRVVWVVIRSVVFIYVSRPSAIVGI